MSAGTGSNTHSTIYIHLIDDGTTVVRPTQGAPLGNNLYRVLAPSDYNPTDEHWQFPPGSIVRCVTEKWNGDDVLVAHEALFLPEDGC